MRDWSIIARESLHQQFGRCFSLVESTTKLHETPPGNAAVLIRSCRLEQEMLCPLPKIGLLHNGADDWNGPLPQSGDKPD